MQKNIKSEYGKPREIINEQIQNIMELLVISDANPAKVLEFYKTLCASFRNIGKSRKS